MRDEEFQHSGRKVRSADAAVFRAVEHSAAQEKKPEHREVHHAVRQPQVRIPQVSSAQNRQAQQPRRPQPQKVQQSQFTEQAYKPQRTQRPEQQPSAGARTPAPAKREPQARPNTKKTRLTAKEAKTYGIRKRNRFVAPLLVILLLFIIIMVAEFLAFDIYDRDTRCIVREHTIEAGTTANVDMYITGEPMFPEYVSCNLDFSTVNYIIPQTIRFTVRMYGMNFPCVLNIVDTTPPTAEVIPQTMFSIDNIPPVEECVTNIYDLNDTTVEWIDSPDITTGGNFFVKAAVTDSSGNVTIVRVPFVVTRDKVAPVIEGMEDIEVYIGDPIKYRENITVTDDIDPNPILEVDTSEVIMDEEGTYTVTYRAYDFTGNVSEETIELTLIEKPDTYVEPELVYEEAQDILDSITWDSMTDMERALAITYWVRYNVYYVSNCDDSSWTRAAYDGLTKRSGNCYTFAMTAKALFDVAGIENMVIIRDPYIYNPHYWNYIKIDGEWYHCDSTPRMGYDSYFFMYTTEELENFWHNGWNGYSFDEDLYPESAEESVQWRINYGSHSIRD